MAKFFWLASAFVMKNRLAVLWVFLVAWLVGGYLYMLHTSPPGDEPTKVSWEEWRQGVEAVRFSPPDAGSKDGGEKVAVEPAAKPEGHHKDAGPPVKRSTNDDLQEKFCRDEPPKITACRTLQFVLEPHKHIPVTVTGCKGAIELVFTLANPRRMRKFALDIRVPRFTLVVEREARYPRYYCLYNSPLLGTDLATAIWGWDGEVSKSFYVVGLKPGQQADLAFTAKSVLDR